VVYQTGEGKRTIERIYCLAKWKHAVERGPGDEARFQENLNEIWVFRKGRLVHIVLNGEGIDGEAVKRVLRWGETL